MEFVKQLWGIALPPLLLKEDVTTFEVIDSWKEFEGRPVIRVRNAPTALVLNGSGQRRTERWGWTLVGARFGLVDAGLFGLTPCIHQVIEVGARFGLVDAGLGLFYDRSPLDHRSLGACNMVGVISRSPATSDQWHEDQEYVLSHTTLSAEEGGSTDCWLEPVIKPWRNSSANLSPIPPFWKPRRFSGGGTIRATFGGALASRELWFGRSGSDRYLSLLCSLVTRVSGRIPFGASCPRWSLAREAFDLVIGDLPCRVFPAWH